MDSETKLRLLNLYDAFLNVALMEEARWAAPECQGVCVGHGAELTGRKSPCQVFAEPTCLPAGRRRGAGQEPVLSLSKETGIG